MKHHWQKKAQQGPAKQRGEIREGVIQHHGHFAFMLAEKEGEGDVFLRGRSLALAMDGDRVSARVHRESSGKLAGEILRVVTRARSSIVGILTQLPSGWAVIPEKKNAPQAQVIACSSGVTLRAGVLALLEVTRWPTDTEGAAGTITEIIGDPDDVHARITAALHARGIRESFPKDVVAQSAALPAKLEPTLWQGREELFDLTVFTIDGKDAKDFDDAVSIEPQDNGMVRLGVHIADVGQYVQAGSALDTEAYTRSTSVYLADRVVPMLPPALSNNLCSLVPDEERLTVSVFMDIDPHGAVTRRSMAESVIRSCRRFTYEEVEVLLDGGQVESVSAVVGEAVARMGALANLLYRQRIKRGALDFNLPEYTVETDQGGTPLRVALRSRLKSHRLVEEFMLLANEAIATELMAAHKSFLHRRHDEPDPTKIQTLAKTLGDMGLSAGHITGAHMHKAIQDVLKQAQSHPLADIINALIVRSMKQAVYSPVSSGHFGIAIKQYAHFTSPIRRYPDLMAHRAIKALVRGEKENHESRPLAEAGVHCSVRERTAADAEYKALDIMRAELFKKKIGMILDGTVTTTMARGSFVLCADTGTEGMLRVTGLAPGTKVKVMVDAVDVAEGKISLSLAQKPPIPTQWKATTLKVSKRRGRNRSRK